MISQKVLVIAGHSGSLINFRGPLLKKLRDNGHSVWVAAPGLSEDVSTQHTLASLGITGRDVFLSRTGVNPFADLRSLVELVRLMWAVRPDVVLTYTIKPVIWGTMAARFAGVARRVCLITGLGYAFTGEAKGKRRIIQWIARTLYRWALARATLVFFQNPDDRQVFRDLGLLLDRVPSQVVNGSGVDTEIFAHTPLPESPTRFLMIARLLGDKGVREYAAAAAIVRVQAPHVQFDLVGDFDSNPDSIRKDELEEWCKAGHLNWLGHLEDVKPAIKRSHVYVLPSYREGTPRTVLEAMSIGRAIVTTDAPGCRETTVPGWNGFLVPVADPDALAASILQFVNRPGLIERMGQASRQRAEDKYDVRKVNAVMLSAIGL
jgi:glycosyltransferase involved in cell wall biosynthesis